MTTGSINDLMKDGIRYVRDGRYNDAYRTFREVVNRDPNNEHAWIWISQTSSDLAERRMAIDKAFEINPGSEHARQALARLEQEQANAAPPPPSGGVIGGSEARSGGGRVRLTSELDQQDDLRAAMGARDDDNKKKGKKGKQPDPRASGDLRQSPQMVTQRTQPQRKRGNPLRVISLVLLILAILAMVAVVWFRNQQQNQVATTPDATTVATETTAAATTPAVETTAAAATTPAVETTANATTAAATTVAANATTAAATTATGGGLAATPTPVAGASAPATATGPASTAVPGTSGQAGAEAQLNQAQQSIAQGDYKGAITLLNQAVNSDPRSLSANFRLGAAYLAAPTDQLPTGVDRFAEAIKSFQRVTELAPTWPGGYARLGEAYAAKGDIPAAINAFTKSLELDPNGPERWLALASLYDKNNQPAEASYARTRAQGLNTPAASPAAATTAAPAVTPTTAAASGAATATPTVRR